VEFFVHETSHAAHRLVFAKCSWNKHANSILTHDVIKTQEVWQ